MKQARHTSEPRLFAVVVTYRRQATIIDMLQQVMAQSKNPEVLLVVDNEDSAETKALIQKFANSNLSTEIRYVAADENLGPAGGWALGMNQCLAEASDRDWILTLDDNDPPRTHDDVAKVFEMAVAAHERDESVAGAAVLGARFNWRTGLLVRVKDEDIEADVPVDYIAGGKMAMYNVSAVREVGTFDTKLFYGAVEVEYGLRLRRAGRIILAHSELWMWRRRNSDRVSIEVSADKHCTIHWQKYYRIRNYIYMMCRFRRYDLALRWAFIQCLVKPFCSLFFRPRQSLSGFWQAVRATRDGFTGRMGRTVDPPIGDGGNI